MTESASVFKNFKEKIVQWKSIFVKGFIASQIHTVLKGHACVCQDMVVLTAINFVLKTAMVMDIALVVFALAILDSRVLTAQYKATLAKVFSVLEIVCV